MESPSTPGTAHSTSPPREAPSNAAFENENATMSCIRFLISNAAAGSVIGKGGATISEFQTQSGARIQLSRNHEYFPGTTDRVIALSGTTNEILRAFNLILSKLYSEVQGDSNARANQVRLIVPHNVCGAIIGKGGATIRSFVDLSHAIIKLSSPDQAIPGLRDRLVTITGTFEQQLHAVALITEKISEDANYTQYASAPMLYTGKDLLGLQRLQGTFPASSAMGYGVPQYAFYGAKGVSGPFPTTVRGSPVQLSLPVVSPTSPASTTSVMMPVPDECIGVIVGRGGKTITEMQQVCGVRIEVSNRGDFLPGTTDRKVTISGSQECIVAAQQMLTQKMQSIFSEVEQ